MRKIFLFLLICLSLVPAIVSAQTSPIPNENIYYYSYTCPHCIRVEDFFKQYDIVKKFNIIEKEVSQNPANAKEFYDFNVAKGISPDDISVPYLYFGGQSIIGDQNVIDFFKIKLNLADEGINIVLPQVNSQKASLTLWAVTVAAAADSINPCAFSVIIFLLLSLLAIGARKRMIKVGLVYIITVYVVYLAAGLGLLAAMQWLSPISHYILWGAAILAILAGLINIKDFFFYGKGLTLAIPEDKKPLLEKYIKHASLPAAVILGFLVALFELPCTGGFYLAILALLAAQSTYWSGVAYLVFYNLIFVLPLLIILLIVYKGVKPEQLEKWRQAKRTWLRLVMGLILIGLGLALIFLF